MAEEKLPSCGCKNSVQHFCGCCGAVVCPNHDSYNEEEKEYECADCAKATRRLKSGVQEVVELAKMTGASRVEQIIEKIKFTGKVAEEGLEDEEPSGE